MSDYIKREDAEKILAEAIKQAEENTGCVIVDTFIGWSSIESYAQEAMSDAPSADVVEVRHGHWIKTETNYQCSECHLWFSIFHTYCPHCGARMDGESDE